MFRLTEDDRRDARDDALVARVVADDIRCDERLLHRIDRGVWSNARSSRVQPLACVHVVATADVVSSTSLAALQTSRRTRCFPRRERSGDFTLELRGGLGRLRLHGIHRIVLGDIFLRDLKITVIFRCGCGPSRPTPAGEVSLPGSRPAARLSKIRAPSSGVVADCSKSSLLPGNL